MFSFLVHISSLSLLILIFAEELTNQTCLLPFVIRPCVNDGRNLWCTFSLDSFERRNTCDVLSVALIFTTFHVELFIIPQYYQQLALSKENFIKKLIIESTIINGTYKYLHWLLIPVLSLEISTNTPNFEIIHEIDDITITHSINALNKSYWHLNLWPIQRSVCYQTHLNSTNLRTNKYDCPKPRVYHHLLCGYTYVCLNGHPCYYTGYQRLVCQIKVLHFQMRFNTLDNSTQYETIYIDVSNMHPYILHKVHEDSFILNKNSVMSKYIAKQIVIVIHAGIIQIFAKLLETSRQLQIRIEHDSCATKNVIIDILENEDNYFQNNLFDYKTTSTGAHGCHINENINQTRHLFRPTIQLRNPTLVHAGQPATLICIVSGLLPFTIEWFRDDTSVEPKKTMDIYTFPSVHDMLFMELYIRNVSIQDHTVKYRVEVTNRVTDISNIVTPMQNLTVKQGTNVTLEARIDGNPVSDVYIHWLNFSQRLYPSHNEQILYQYGLLNVQLNQSTSYTFVAVSKFHQQNVSRTIFLTVFDELYFLISLSNISVEEHEDLNLTVPFSHPIIRAQWFVNDKFIEGTSIKYTQYIEENQVSLVINNISLEYDGEYKVQVWDVLNQTNDSVFYIRIYFIATFIIDCNNQMDLKIYSVSLTCIFQAKSPQIQWFDPANQTILNHLDYESIDESNYIHEAKLVFTKLVHEQFGIYTFQVHSIRGDIVTRQVNLNVTALPIINSSNFHLGKAYAHQDDSFSFILHFNGIPWPNITLFFDNKTLIQYSNPGDSPISLFLTNLTTKNEGIYFVRVMNSAGFVETNRTELCLFRAPSFISPNQSISSIIYVKPHQTINLILPIIKTNSPDPLTLLWFVRNQTIKQTFHTNLLQSNLTLPPSLQAEYITCLVESHYGELVYHFKLHYIQAPVFILALHKRFYVDIGTNVTLIIIIAANPIPTIQWLHNNCLLDDKQYQDHISHGYGLYSLIIRNMTLTDIGNYTVIVSNSENVISSSTEILLKSITLDGQLITSSTAVIK
ncbi:unnamed protein product [Adineta ricciae]|uniref:Ig-like domain-containing protein n=1 Tax=Adineta ricciae TaxID=249248 RepID=A0A814EY99_ADIRI|nr:unnamed protein product [Adineta ricciae]CAF0975610.1 unnamed protein product [Adineta ricciae]